MADRKKELEQKKAKLAALKEEKKRKEDEKRRREVESVAVSPSGGDVRQDVDKLFDELGIPSPVVSSSQLSTSTSRSESVSSVLDSAQQFETQAPIVVKRHIQLTQSKVTQTSIPAKEVVSYTKETQTQQEQFEKEDALYRRYHRSEDDADSMEVGVDTPPYSATAISTHAHHQHHHHMPHVEMARPAGVAKGEVTVKEEKPAPPPELTDEEKTRIMSSEDFARFLDRSIRIIERAVNENVDILVDYSGDDADKDGGLREGQRLKLDRHFFDERWSKHRTITSLDWSDQHPELLLSAYNSNEDNPHEPDGVVLVWNMKFRKTSPEYIFHCQSPITSACFAKFHPTLVVGGTYSGQIVIWDNRSSKRTPVQRTPLSAAAHTHPVFCVQVVGTPNAHNLVSVSTDGKLCAWSMDMLATPAESMELQHRQNRTVTPTCTAFMPGDANNFVVGSEDGAVYAACRHGSRAGVTEIFEGHQGPVTGIHPHSVQGPIDFSNYFISSSFDWTVKLWNVKESRPLYSFEDNSDYIFDAKWSPIHPSLFAAVDGTGRLDLWNLNTDMEVPTATVNAESNVALNKCLWHQSGHHIAAGDDLGKVHIYDVSEGLANPRPDEWQRFVHTLQEMKQNQADQDEANFAATPIR